MQPGTQQKDIWVSGPDCDERNNISNLKKTPGQAWNTAKDFTLAWKSAPLLTLAGLQPALRSFTDNWILEHEWRGTNNGFYVVVGGNGAIFTVLVDDLYVLLGTNTTFNVHVLV